MAKQNHDELLQQLYAALPSFWFDVYDDFETVKGVLSSALLLEENVTALMDILRSTGTPATSPVDRRLVLAPVLLFKNQSSSYLKLRYGQPDTEYGEGQLVYGGDNQQPNQYPYLTPVTSVLWFANRATQPTKTWEPGVDYFYDRDTRSFVFADDLFSEQNLGLLTQRIVDDDLVVVLWANYPTYEDCNPCYERYGYALPAQIAPKDRRSKNFPAFCDAAYSILRDGISHRGSDRLLSAIFDTPLTGDKAETVEAIWPLSATEKVLITDSAVYRVPERLSTPVVGTTLPPRSFITEDLQTGLTVEQALPYLSTFVVDADFIDNGRALGFPNRDVPTTITTDDNGNIRVEFPLVGLAEDVTWFFDAIHAKGLTTGQSLAWLLDSRTNKLPDEPAALGAIPATVNPAKLLLRELWNLQSVFVRFRLRAAGKHRMSADLLTFVNSVISPQSRLFYLFESEFEPEALPDNIEEELSTSDAGAEVSDDLDSGSLSDALVLSYTDPVCD